MNRRTAVVATLAGICAAMTRTDAQTTVPSGVFTYPLPRIRIGFHDPGDPSAVGGFESVEVVYKGQSIILTGREIFEALSNRDAAQE